MKDTRPLKRQIAHLENAWRRDPAVKRFRERIARAQPGEDLTALRERLHIVEQEAQARAMVEIDRLKKEL